MFVLMRPGSTVRLGEFYNFLKLERESIMLLEDVLSKLEGVQKCGSGFVALCPGHDDRQKSLSVSVSGNKILMHCHAGCRTEDLISKIGLSIKDLYMDTDKRPPGNNFHIVAVHPYEDKAGKLRYQSVKLDPKSFRVRRINGNGDFEWNLKGVEPLPYKLPQIIKAFESGETVYVVEGEKDADNLLKLGFVATTNHGGAGKWRDCHSKYFPAGAEVVILPDNDKPGKKHAENVAQQLFKRGCKIKVVELPGLPEKGDVSDWIDTGHTKEDLLELVWNTEYWQDIQEEKSDSRIEQVFNLTDTGNGRRIARDHKQDIRYCHIWGCWEIWNGRYWEKDSSGEIYRRAKNTVASIYSEAAIAIDSEQRKTLAAHATRSESEARINAMINLAKSEPGIPVSPNMFDIDPWLLNCENGTLNLKTMELYQHRRENLITKLAPVSYDMTAECPIWISFLQKIMNGNQGLITFIQKALGYTLTGDTREQVLFILYGTGANGKSTLINTIISLLGDYALQTPAETFLQGDRSGGIPNDIARLRGARFVAAVEAGEGRRLSEVLIKQLTGQDTITARFLHQEFFEFKPICKIFLATNHKPRISGTDHAIWRRVRLIPFNVTIPESERDKELPDKLKSELPGILAWAVRGCLGWQELGLGMPEEIRNATEGYRADMDLIANFLDECCNISSFASVWAGDLYDAYTAWCSVNGEKAHSQRRFGMSLTERGFIRERGTAGRIRWLGIGLIEVPKSSERKSKNFLND